MMSVKTKSKKESVLVEALRVTGGARQENYGHPRLNHERIARLWRAHIWGRFGIDLPLEAADAAWMMVQVKQARHMHTRKRDNLTDAAGYVRCVSRIDGFEE